ncbi:ABC-type antimicrobial peptide transport system permease subunit [Maribacter caenipelagi]|uniref:ABC-type antimicrobial peptide transport system permease subunit n=1 Tax=Maribacter caenipelagi TaxID=1447781 RepID=A0A4R7CXE7_9FLAO|nr:ABC transporter permease [Maribacter caenipelagi]TDS12587.1 ABC-type antimicrobial peptide transport system permease subunit [Maribacter caenipelagi]
MFHNNLKIAWRSLKTNRMFSGINILGLSLGLAITIVLFLFISYERSFDKEYEHKEEIFRVLVQTDESYGKEILCTAPAAVAPAIKTDIPSVKKAARILKHGFGETAFVKVGNTNFLEKELYWCDPELFEIFNIKILEGRSYKELERPNTVALSQSTAKRYFGSEDPIGKTILVDNEDQLEVVGIFPDFASNSSISFNAIGSFSSTFAFKEPSWGNSSFETYVQLDPGASIATTELQMQSVLDKNVDKAGQWFSLTLQPLENVHLFSAGYVNSYSKHIGDISEIRNLTFLALLILLIACVNYMNLMTAKSQKRTKDVGINKTLGASSKSLVIRFYAETGLVTLISLFIGIGISALLLPAFNTITGMELEMSLLFRLEMLTGLVVFWLTTTLVAGSYPAFYLSKSSPNAALNPGSKGGKGVINLRKGLVVLQFAASVVLIVSVTVIYQQLEFMQQQKLGYEPENTIAVTTGGIRGTSIKQTLVKEFKSLSMVSDVAMAQGFPGISVSGRTLFKNENDENGTQISTNHSDAQVIELLKLNLLAGKTLPLVKQEGDTLVEVVLNKKAIEYLGYSPEEAVGKKVLIGGFGEKARIMGVVDNFNYESLHRPIGAYAFHNRRSEAKSFVLLRVKSADLTDTMHQLKSTFESVITDAAFEYVFLDKNMERLYAQEHKTALMGLIFCVLAIFVACLGLFGLAAFTAEQRKKEIGVRKVLGASVLGITQMLSKDFLKLVLVAVTIAFPMAYWLMTNWLHDFAYRVTIGWTVFALAGILALFIALVTVSFQAISAARANPVKSLRTE